MYVLPWLLPAGASAPPTTPWASRSPLTCSPQLPRAFINVVEVMELTGLHQGQGGKCGIPLVAQ